MWQGQNLCQNLTGDSVKRRLVEIEASEYWRCFDYIISIKDSCGHVMEPAHEKVWYLADGHTGSLKH